MFPLFTTYNDNWLSLQIENISAVGISNGLIESTTNLYFEIAIFLSVTFSIYVLSIHPFDI